ncbi:SCO family protein [Pedobacter mucosus]|uniref:SCO family protein n=1 Tax=Pedobacter mucosus TaxID=2895286 RepID=UPI001EE475B2|nr:SCO family protein [Pedobacter mucosus]UKT63125.1 SCO family protein [Pedobacter mucosus]
MKQKSIKKALILVSILAIPGFLFFYLLPHFAKNRYKSLPIFGEKVVAKTFHSVKGKKIPDTIYHQVPDFKLTNQNTDTVSWKSLQDKITVLNLFYTANATKEAGKNLKQLEEYYHKNKLLRFVSISVDPAENINTLKAYAKSLNAEAGKWDVLAGDTSTIYPLIRKGLLLDVIHNGETDNSKFIFSNQILLLDNQHRIRGYYEATNPDALAKLDDEIKVLVAEDLRNIKDGR